MADKQKPEAGGTAENRTAQEPSVLQAIGQVVESGMQTIGATALPGTGVTVGDLLGALHHYASDVPLQAITSTKANPEGLTASDIGGKAAEAVGGSTGQHDVAAGLAGVGAEMAVDPLNLLLVALGLPPAAGKAAQAGAKVAGPLEKAAAKAGSLAEKPQPRPLAIPAEMKPGAPEAAAAPELPLGQMPILQDVVMGGDGVVINVSEALDKLHAGEVLRKTVAKMAPSEQEVFAREVLSMPPVESAAVALEQGAGVEGGLLKTRQAPKEFAPAPAEIAATPGREGKLPVEAPVVSPQAKGPVERFNIPVEWVGKPDKKPLMVAFSELDLASPAKIQQAVERLANARIKAGHVVPEANVGAEGHVVIPRELAKELGRVMGVSKQQVRNMALDPRLGVAQAQAIGDVVKAADQAMRGAIAEAKARPTLESYKAFEQAFNDFNMVGVELKRYFTEGAQVLRAAKDPEMQALMHLERVTAGLEALRDAAGNLPISAMMGVIDKMSSAQLVKAATMAQSVGWNSFNEIMYFNMLSAIKTHVVNTVGSGFIMPVLSISDRQLGRMAGIMEGWWTGKTGPAISTGRSLDNVLNAGVAPGEAAIGLRAAVDSVKNMMTTVRQTYQTDGIAGLWTAAQEIKPIRAGLQRPTERGITADNYLVSKDPVLRAVVNGIGDILRGTQTAMRLEDAATGMLAYDMEMRMLAYRKAYHLGYEGKSLDDYIKNVLRDPTEHPDIMQGAIDFKMLQTFTSAIEGRTGMLVNGLSHPLMRSQLPFITTTINMFKASLSHVPVVSSVLPSVRADILAGGARAQMAMGKMLTGSLVMASAVPLYLGDFITGKGPQEPTARAAWLADGYQDYSFHFDNGVNVSYVQSTPFGDWLKMVASAMDVVRYAQDEHQWNEIALVMTLAFVREQERSNWVGQFHDFTDIAYQAKSDGDPVKAERLMAKWAAGASKIGVPAATMQAARLLGGGKATVAAAAAAGAAAVAGSRLTASANQAIFDDEYKSVHDGLQGYLDHVMETIPILSKSVPPKLDLLTGQPQTHEMATWNQVVPFTLKGAEKDPVADKLVELYNTAREIPVMQAVPRTVNGEHLTPEEMNQYIHLYTHTPFGGLTLHEALRAEIADPQFGTYLPGIQATILAAVWHGYTQAAKAQMAADGNTKFLGYQRIEKRTQALTGQSAGLTSTVKAE